MGVTGGFQNGVLLIPFQNPPVPPSTQPTSSSAEPTGLWALPQVRHTPSCPTSDPLGTPILRIEQKFDPLAVRCPTFVQPLSRVCSGLF